MPARDSQFDGAEINNCGLVRAKGFVWFVENIDCRYSFHISGRGRFDIQPMSSNDELLSKDFDTGDLDQVRSRNCLIFITGKIDGSSRHEHLVHHLNDAIAIDQKIQLHSDSSTFVDRQNGMTIENEENQSNNAIDPKLADRVVLTRIVEDIMKNYTYLCCVFEQESFSD